MARDQAALEALPTELVREIASNLNRPKDILDLVLVNKQLRGKAIPCLWEQVMLPSEIDRVQV